MSGSVKMYRVAQAVLKEGGGYEVDEAAPPKFERTIRFPPSSNTGAFSVVCARAQGV